MEYLTISQNILKSCYIPRNPISVDVDYQTKLEQIEQCFKELYTTYVCSETQNYSSRPLFICYIKLLFTMKKKEKSKRSQIHLKKGKVHKEDSYASSSSIEIRDWIKKIKKGRITSRTGIVLQEVRDRRCNQMVIILSKYYNREHKKENNLTHLKYSSSSNISQGSSCRPSYIIEFVYQY